MSDLEIECPHCHKPFKLNETLAAPLVEETRRKLQEELEGQEEEFEERRKAFAEEQKAAAKERKAIEGAGVAHLYPYQGTHTNARPRTHL